MDNLKLSIKKRDLGHVLNKENLILSLIKGSWGKIYKNKIFKQTILHIIVLSNIQTILYRKSF